MFVDLMSDIYHTFTERFLRAQITFEAPPVFEEAAVGNGSRRSTGTRGPTRRYNALGVLEDLEPEEVTGGDGAEEVVDVGPAEPPTKKVAARPEPVVTGAGRVRSLNAATGGAIGGATSADWSNVGRNDPCPCGSGKKFKKCHGATA